MTTEKLAACAVLAFLCGCTGMPPSNAMDEALIAKIQTGQTKEQVRTVLGSPNKVLEFANLQREVWDYPHGNSPRKMVLSVQFSRDGIVREVLDMTAPEDQISNYGAGSGN